MLLTKQISEIKEIHLENNTTKCTYIVHYNYYNIVYDYSNTLLCLRREELIMITHLWW